MSTNYGNSYGTFGVLNTAYSGLQVSQTAIGVVSNNVANANNDGYTRQRAVIQARTPINAQNGDLGTGAQVVTVERIHNEFLYTKYTAASQAKEFTDFERSTLEEVSKYFPDIQANGIANDMQNYFDAWQSCANSPADSSQTIALAQKADVLATNINDTANRLKAVRTTLDNQIVSNVDEINRLGAEIADLNGRITANESNGQANANDLRDKRDADELAIMKLVNVEISKSQPQTDMAVDPQIADKTKKYVMEIGGMPLVDGKNFHPLVVATDPNSASNQFHSVYFESQDYSLTNITSKLDGGKLGAIIDLRGAGIDPKTNEPTTGKVQSYIDMLNTFSNSLIENTNNTYARSATNYMQSNEVSTLGNEPLAFMPLHIKSGTFDAVVYDASGNEVARKTIAVDTNTDTLSTIATKLNAPSDDNKDGNATNDFANYFNAKLSTGTKGSFQIMQSSASSVSGYTFSIEDSSTNSTNFAGALGLSKFFDGTNASNIALNYDLAQDTSKIHSFSAPVQGNNDVANSMVQLQYDHVNFNAKNGVVTTNTISGYYNNLNAVVSTDANTAGIVNDSSVAMYNSVKTEYDSVSKVSIDEELINLVKFQSGYSASAKVVSTIDQMINTLLGMKQ